MILYLWDMYDHKPLDQDADGRQEVESRSQLLFASVSPPLVKYHLWRRESVDSRENTEVAKIIGLEGVISNMHFI